MKKLLYTLLPLLITQNAISCPEGYLEPDSILIPFPSTSKKIEKRYLSQEDFDEALNLVGEIYNYYYMPAGINMVMEGYWDNNSKNGTVRRSDNKWRVLVYGGYATSPHVTKDVIIRTACHEVGHHFGGTNFYPGDYFWAAGEGQSDYYTTLKCLRMVFAEEDNAAYLAKKNLDPYAIEKCDEVWGSQTKESYICQRSALAAHDWVAVQSGSHDSVSFSKPSPKVIEKTTISHPAYQCRLDTMFQGALCAVDHNERPNSEDAMKYAEGTCTRKENFEVGTRPLCWFNPKDFKSKR